MSTSIWTQEQQKLKREKLIDCLYTQCRVRTATSKQVFEGLVADLGLIGTAHIADKAVEIIRPYKNSGANLEATVNSLYDLLYPAQKENIGLWNANEP